MCQGGCEAGHWNHSPDWWCSSRRIIGPFLRFQLDTANSLLSLWQGSAGGRGRVAGEHTRCTNLAGTSAAPTTHPCARSVSGHGLELSAANPVALCSQAN